MKKTRFFVVGTEGATSDGRVIERAHIEQMAKNYDPAKYAARINLEHYRGIDPQGLFKAYGDVAALKAEEKDGKLQLLAQLAPTDELVALNKSRQKIFTSMEISPSFADTKEAYLVGLAVTDSPASLGTEMLEFSAKMGDAGPLASRKQHKDNLFTAAQEAVIEFDVADSGESSLLSAAVQALSAIAEKFTKTPEHITPAVQAKVADVVAGEASAEIGRFMSEAAKLLGDIQKDMVPAGQFKALKGQFDALNQQFSDLKKQLETETGGHYSHRSPSTGGEGKDLAQF